MSRAITSSFTAIQLAENLSGMGFTPHDVEGNTLFFRKKVRVTPEGQEYRIQRGKREPATARSLHEVVETLTNLGV